MVAIKRFLVLLVLGLIPQVALAANVLSGVNAKRLGTDFIVELTFDEDVSEKDARVEYVNGTIEIQIPKAITPQVKVFSKVSDKYVRHIYTNQQTPDSIRSRVILQSPHQAGDFKATTALFSRANRLFVKIGDPVTQVATKPGSSEMPGELIDRLMQESSGIEPGAATAAAVSASGKAASENLPVNAETIDAESLNTKLTDESQPVFKKEAATDKQEKSSMWLWGRMVISLVVVLAILAAALYFIRRYPAAKKLTGRGRMIEVLAQHHLGPKKSVAIVKVAGEAVLIGVTDTSINILKSLSLLDDDMTLTANPQPPKKFAQSLAASLKTKGGEFPEVKDSRNRAGNEEIEEFSMKGLKEIVGERLRSMKEL